MPSHGVSDDFQQASGTSIVGATARPLEEPPVAHAVGLDIILEWPDELRYLSGVSAMEGERLGEAISFFQSIPRQSTFFHRASKHLARCYSTVGHHEAALERMISILPELKGDECMEIATAIAHTYEVLGVPERSHHYHDLAASVHAAYRDLRPDIDELAADSTFLLERLPPDFRSQGVVLPPIERPEVEINYDLVSYMRYEYASHADAVKKDLEMDHAQKLVLRFREPQKRSLDIGCATGRYPFWLASEGFEATGYDVSKQAIEICQKRAQGSEISDHVAFELRDIVKDGTPHDHFDLITSMMGTFNHIRPSGQPIFLARCYTALREGGRLVLSCWNPSSSYLGMLSIYTLQERTAILRNSMLPAALKAILMDAGFVDISVKHLCFLPDECYEAWAHKLPRQQLCRLDSELSRFVGDLDAQMYLLTARKGSHKRSGHLRSARQAT